MAEIRRSPFQFKNLSAYHIQGPAAKPKKPNISHHAHKSVATSLAGASTDPKAPYEASDGTQRSQTSVNPRCDVFLPGKPYRNTSGWADFQAPLATKSGDFGLLAKYVEEVKAREEARGKSSKLVGPVDEDDSVLAEGGSSVEKVEQVEKGKSNAILVSEPANKDASRKIDTEDWMIDLSWELGAQEAGDEGGFREEALAELQHKFAVVMDGTEMEKSEGLEAVVENSKYLLKAKAFGSGSKHEGSRVPQREDYYEPMIPSRWRDPRKAKKGVEKAHEHGFDDLLLCGEHVKVEIATHEVDVWATEIVSLLD